MSKVDMNVSSNKTAVSPRIAVKSPALRTRHAARARGFTLIELLLVLVILAVLAALVVPKFTNRSKQARETAAKTDLSTIASAIDRFEVEASRYPNTIDELMTKPADVENWTQGLDKMPKDPWGHEYVYKYPGQQNQNAYDLYSLGPDGREGNDDIYK